MHFRHKYGKHIKQKKDTANILGILFLFVNIVGVIAIQLLTPSISLVSQTETFLQFLLKFLRDK